MIIVVQTPGHFKYIGILIRCTLCTHILKWADDDDDDDGEAEAKVLL